MSIRITNKEGTAMKIMVKDKEYDVPAVTLGQLRNGILDAMRAHDDLIGQGKTFEAMIARGEIFAKVMQHRYGDELSEADLMEAIDMANLNTVWSHMLGLSGLIKPGEAPTQTESPPSGT